ncbi:MAG: hypothetical protein AAF721_16015 [Myxococcota bacterium]
MNRTHAALTLGLGLALVWSPATAAPPPAPSAKAIAPAPAADFKFVVPVDLKNLHRQAVTKGVWVVCNVYDHGVAAREQAHTELESKWTLAKAEEIQRWHLGQGRRKLSVNADGSLSAKVNVEVNVDEASGEPSDARSWECHLAIASSKLPTRDRSKPAYLRAKRGTVFMPVHRGDL